MVGRLAVDRETQGSNPSSGTKSLSQRMREHVHSRGGMAKDKFGKPVVVNGAWQMMCDAADRIEELEKIIADGE